MLAYILIDEFEEKRSKINFDWLIEGKTVKRMTSYIIRESISYIVIRFIYFRVFFSKIIVLIPHYYYFFSNLRLERDEWRNAVVPNGQWRWCVKNLLCIFFFCTCIVTSDNFVTKVVYIITIVSTCLKYVSLIVFNSVYVKHYVSFKR